ncbi:MAG: hypothetical protein HRT73_12140 [Flavobacteriales bacterium]|nr:hypothetical protein [Flavobacteriales bacterium]
MKYLILLLIMSTVVDSKDKTLYQQGRTEYTGQLTREVKHDDTTKVKGGSVRIILETDKHQAGTNLTLYNNSSSWIAIRDVEVCRKMKICNRHGRSLRDHKKCGVFHIAPNGSQQWQYNYQVFGTHNFKNIAYKITWKAITEPSNKGHIHSCI